MDYINIFIEPLSVIIVAAILYYLNLLIFDKITFFSSKDKASLWRGIIAFIISLLGILFFIIFLPISAELKGQILSLVGIVLSAGVALSSTTLLGNLLAGVMNNSENRFKSGDLIEVDLQKNNLLKGKVTKKSFLYTEIQLEDSNFLTIPNLYLATKPVKNTRKSDSVISTTVSLGYDVSREKIEKTLKKGAKEAGLKDPYVYVTKLGDFSVVYKIHGFLDDTDKYFSTSYYLNKTVMDALHEEGIEIVSPTFMNQRQVNDKEFIYKSSSKQEKKEDNSHEDQVFDKANSYEELEEQKEELQKKLKNTEDKKEKTKIKENIKKVEEAKENMEKENE